MPAACVVGYCSMKFTVAVVCTLTGWPFNKKGWYTHCLTASIAAWVSIAGPEMACTFWTFPSVPTSRLIWTVPCILAVRAVGGYSGGTLGSAALPSRRHPPLQLPERAVRRGPAQAIAAGES